MTKISKKPAYPPKVNIVESDYIPGTNSETTGLETVTFSFEAIRAFTLAGLSPDLGGTLKISEITYTGEDFNTPSEVLNSLLPNYSVLRYHLLVVSVNGYKWILKLQDIVVGNGQDAVSDSDFIEIPTSIGPTGNGIVSVVKTSTVGLIDTYTITYTNATTSTFDVTNGTQGDQGNQGVAGKGISTIIKTNTVGLVDTYTITFTDSSTTTFDVTNGANGTNGTNGTDAVNDNQKVITYPADFTVGNYTLINTDKEYTFFIENGSNNVTITVPSGLISKFQAGFIHKGTGNVTFLASGTTINNPIGLKSKGTGYPTFLIQQGNSNVYSLLGNTKV